MANIEPGSIVERNGERRVVVDIAGDLAVLRYPDDDECREVDDDGGDIHLSAAPVTELVAVDD